MDGDWFDWQTCVSLVIVALAIFILLRKTWAAFVKPSGCGSSCQGCSLANEQQADSPALVQLKSAEPR